MHSTEGQSQDDSKDLNQNVGQQAVDQLSLIRKAAKDGDSESQRKLGFFYERGLNVRQNSRKAIVWYLKAAKQNNLYACSALGVLYLNGSPGIPRDPVQSMLYFLQAAELGDALSPYYVAHFYLKGDGVPEDVKQAVPWLEQSAQRGESIAYTQLGYCYERGAGVDEDGLEAVVCHQKAGKPGQTELYKFLNSNQHIAQGLKERIVVVHQGEVSDRGIIRKRNRRRIEGAGIFPESSSATLRATQLNGASFKKGHQTLSKS